MYLSRLKYFIVGVIYVIGSLIVGEVHPFTLVPMYNNFPNWAFSFYLSDDSSRLMPIAQYFKYGDDELSHQYASICRQLNIPYTNLTAADAQQKKAGAQLMQLLKTRQYATFFADNIQLHRVCYFIRNDSIAKNDIVIYEGRMDEL